MFHDQNTEASTVATSLNVLKGVHGDLTKIPVSELAAGHHRILENEGYLVVDDRIVHVSDAPLEHLGQVLRLGAPVDEELADLTIEDAIRRAEACMKRQPELFTPGHQKLFIGLLESEAAASELVTGTSSFIQTLSTLEELATFAQSLNPPAKLFNQLARAAQKICAHDLDDVVGPTTELFQPILDKWNGKLLHEGKFDEFVGFKIPDVRPGLERAKGAFVARFAGIEGSENLATLVFDAELKKFDNKLAGAIAAARKYPVGKGEEIWDTFRAECPRAQEGVPESIAAFLRYAGQVGYAEAILQRGGLSLSDEALRESPVWREMFRQILLVDGPPTHTRYHYERIFGAS